MVANKQAQPRRYASQEVEVGVPVDLGEAVVVVRLQVPSHPRERVEGYRARGETITWEEFDDEWKYYMTTTHFCCRLVGLYKVGCRQYRPKPHEGGEYGKQLKQAVDDYYAPCPCEADGSFWKMRPKDAAQLLRKQRRKHFEAAAKGALKSPRHSIQERFSCYTAAPVAEHAGWRLCTCASARCRSSSVHACGSPAPELIRMRPPEVCLDENYQVHCVREQYK
jgi:hypothetical protein